MYAQHISTAPKDGSIILGMDRNKVLAPEFARCDVVAWATACVMEARAVLEAHGGKSYANEVLGTLAKP